MDHIETRPTFNISQILNDFMLLTKFRLSLSVVVSSIAGYLLAAPAIDYGVVLLLLTGGYAIVGASNAFNQWIEKERDLLMMRTRNRPLPAGRMSKRTAFLIASFLSLLGIVLLYLINIRTAFFALLSILIYTCLYTPLKQKTPLSVFVGAVPGAIPFMLGWVAASNRFGIEAGVLFMIQFFWQFPHFWAIAWSLEDDYAKAGFKMLPTGKTDGATAFQILFYSLWMLVASLIPAWGITGTLSLSPVAAVCIVISGLPMIYYTLALMRTQQKEYAKKLILAGIIYISLLQLVYVIDKFI